MYMQKNIKLTLCENGNITIYLEEEKKLCIENSKKEITANDIFKIFSSSEKCEYKIEKEGSDNDVLEYFYELFVQIAERINKIELDENIE